MSKDFYTEKDIEDMVKRGVLSLVVNENVVLTELAHEKASRLGMRLLISQPDNPPAAPVRPYLSEKPTGGPATPFSSLPGPTVTAAQSDLAGRIRSQVLSKLGTQVDPVLLDTIILRVLKSTGLK